MANVKISQLPSWTGSSADLRWFVMNNSGETETFKFSGYTSPLKESDGVDSFVNVYDLPSKTAGDYQCIVGGYNNQIQSTQIRDFIFGGYDNVITSKSQGYGGTIVGGAQNTLYGPSDGSGNYGASIFGSQACENNGYFGSIVGAIRGYIGRTNNHANIIGGDTNVISNGSNYGFIGGGSSNTINGGHSATVGGQSNNTAGTNAGFIGGGRFNSLGGGNSDSNYIIGGQYSTAQGINSGVFGGWGTYIYDDGNNSDDTYRRSNNIVGSPYCEIGVNSNNGRNFAGIYTSLYSYIRGVGGSPTKTAVLLGTSGSTITAGNDVVSIIGGKGNTIQRATNTSIINSVNTSVNSGNTYNTDKVTMISCENTDITNVTNSVVLAVSGRTIPSGQPNTTYVDKLTIFGNTTYEATTFNDAGTCSIDIFNMSHVIINATGGTYTLSISPTPSQEGTPELTLLINVSGGATIAFDNSGNTQWRWGNGAGTPSFTNNTRSIIKMAAWAGNDLWEISRSMNMA